MKATYAEAEFVHESEEDQNGKFAPIISIFKIPIFKDPITDDGTKKSLKGLCMLYYDDKCEICVKDECTWEEEKTGLLVEVFRDGKLLVEETLSGIRQRLWK